MKRLILLLVVAVAFAMAQAPEDFPWWDRPIAQNLNLSPEQQTADPGHGSRVS